MTRWLRISLIVAVFGLVGVVLGLLLNGNSRASYYPSGWHNFTFPTEKTISVDELTQKFSGVLLPTWLPPGVKLREIYTWGDQAMLVYSRREVKDYRDAELTMELVKVSRSSTPRTTLEHATKVVSLGDIKAAIYEDVAPDSYMSARGRHPMVAVLDSNGIEYGICAIKESISPDELERIVLSMETG